MVLLAGVWTAMEIWNTNVEPENGGSRGQGIQRFILHGCFLSCLKMSETGVHDWAFRGPIPLKSTFFEGTLLLVEEILHEVKIFLIT